MVNIPQGGMSLHTPGRGIAARGGGGSAPVAAARAGAAAAAALTTPDPTAPSVGTRPIPSAQPAREAVRATWTPARLFATLLRILTAPGAAAGAPAGPEPRAAASPPQSPARPASAAQPSAGPPMAALLRVIAGAPPAPGTAQPAPAPTGTRADQPAATSQPPVASPPPQEMVTAGARAESEALAAAVAQAPAAAPTAAPTAPGEHPSPRAELVPPGDGVRGRNNVDLPIVPAALVALALPVLAAVLASIF